MKSSIKLTSLVIIMTFFLNAFSQDKLLSLKDITYQNRSIFPESLSQLQWMGDTDKFIYVKKESVVMGRAGNAKTDTIIRVDDLNNGMNKLGLDSLSRIPRLTCQGDNIIMFANNNMVFLYDIAKKELRKVNEYNKDASNVHIDEQTYQVAYTLDNNLYVALEGNQRQITFDEDPGIVNGQSVHRNEFGIREGIFWSPKGNNIAFYSMDETMVTEYPLVDVTARFAELQTTRYPMAGMTSHQVKLGIYNISNGETIFLQTGEPADQYLTNVTWGPEEKFVYIAILNRDQDHLKLNKYDAESGAFVMTLFEETSERYVEPEHGMFFINTLPDQFLWFSERDGFDHLYLYNTDGTLITQLTRGNWVVTRFYGFDNKGRFAFIQANKEDPLKRDIYAVNLYNGEMMILTNGVGTHNARFNENKKYFIDISSSTEIAREYSIIDDKGEQKQVLLTDVDPLEDYALGEMSIFTIKNNNDQDLYCRMIKPDNFDPAKEHPVIVYVYGGPHSQLITDSWLGGGQLFLFYLAQQGYIVFTLDNRGTANRGFEFESVIHRNIGIAEVEDQMAGVEYLKSLPYVDENRIGVDGWSYGGFLTISMLLDYPEDFKVGVAGGPVTDWKYYEVMYGERYMDTPESNPEGYKKSCLIDKASKLESKLLILHGTNDGTVVWQNSLMFLKACIDEGIQVDYFVYPGHPHNVRGKDRMHMYQKITDYFNTFLK